MDINKTITDLKRFSPTILDLQNPAQQDLIDGFEKKYKIILPNDFKLFLSLHNGVSLYGTEVYGIEHMGIDAKYALDNCYKLNIF